MDNRHGNLQPLIPHLESFISFLGSDLMADASNPKVVLHAIECHVVVVNQAHSGLVRQHSPAIVENVQRISLDAKPQIKTELYTLIKALMMRCGPQKIW